MEFAADSDARRVESEQTRYKFVAAVYGSCENKIRSSKKRKEVCVLSRKKKAMVDEK